MKKYIYYHLYLPDESAAWANYILEQFKLIEDSGLLEEIDSLYLQVVDKPFSNANRLVIGLANALSPKIKVNVFKDTAFKDDNDLHSLDTDINGKYSRPITERATLQLIYDHACSEDAYFLYMHAKGVTSYQRHLKTHKYIEFKNYFYWRKFLEWGVVENWRMCVDKLNDYDVVGCNYAVWPMKHFSGNYWWSKSDYIKNIANIGDDNWWQSQLSTYPIMNELTWRLRDEMWICSSETCKIYSLKDAEFPPPRSNLAIEWMPRFKYN